LRKYEKTVSQGLFADCITPHITVYKRIRKFTTLHLNNIEYLEHGSRNYFRQNDVHVGVKK